MVVELCNTVLRLDALTTDVSEVRKTSGFKKGHAMSNETCTFTTVDLTIHVGIWRRSG